MTVVLSYLEVIRSKIVKKNNKKDKNCLAHKKNSTQFNFYNKWTNRMNFDLLFTTFFDKTLTKALKSVLMQKYGCKILAIASIMNPARMHGKHAASFFLVRYSLFQLSVKIGSLLVRLQGIPEIEIRKGSLVESKLELCFYWWGSCNTNQFQDFLWNKSEIMCAL